MRCPKCGYISFDVVDKCVKCRKNISAAAAELKGTVVSVPPPGFLSLDYAGPEAEPEEAGAEPEGEAYDLSEEGGEVFVDFSPEEEAVVEAEPAVEEPEPEEAAIDISDLAPVEKEAAPIREEEGGTEEFVFAEVEEPVSESADRGLEDLRVEGIDLFASPPPPSGKDKVVPSVKTGTALDDFEVDLGELFKKK